MSRLLRRPRAPPRIARLEAARWRETRSPVPGAAAEAGGQLPASFGGTTTQRREARVALMLTGSDVSTADRPRAAADTADLVESMQLLLLLLRAIWAKCRGGSKARGATSLLICVALSASPPIV